MKKIYVNELENYLDKEISFSGFVDTIRDKKWVMFVILRDSTGLVQMTIEKSEESNKELLDIMSNITVDSTIKVEGLLKTNGHIRYSYKKCTAWSPLGWCLFGSWEYYDPVYYAINNTADIRFNNSNSLLDYVDVYYTNKETRKSYVIRFEYDDTTKKFTAKSEKQY